jgi:hypothetical protein
VYSNEGFINATMSLESLFNDGDSDIKYKLTHRASFVLGLSGFEPIEVFENLMLFYRFRSRLVHGDEKIKDVENKGNLSRYARRSIIIMHILLNNSKRKKIKINDRKKEILKEIDYAMLLPSERDSLQKEIKKGLEDFILKIPRTFEVGVNLDNTELQHGSFSLSTYKHHEKLSTVNATVLKIEIDKINTYMKSKFHVLCPACNI